MSEHRLPRRARPKAYRLHLTADPAEPTFSGVVEIDIALEDPAKNIELHCEGLRVQSVICDDQTLEPVMEEDRLRLHGSFAPGTCTLRIAYEGDVRQDMAGLYLSQDGDRACLATQCEATDARTILPCFDEPEYKATWQWTITAPEALTVLANGHEESSTTADGQTTHVFAATAPMSSYLIACCIGDFTATDALDARGHAMRVWAMRGQEQHGDHGNALAARMLPWYEDYFGQEYAFGKYDQIAVPSFAFGAMENAGLVLFRPSLVLLDEETASWDDRRHVALVIAHEFAHMWFGNLVTMAWWDDLWLNEAFAEWIAHKCADAMDPSLDVWTPFRQRAAGALSTDALTSTHAIYHPVKTPEEAQEMFDAITYGKGSAVMRMLESYLGQDAFRQGLQTYMAAFKFANAQGKDLWYHLGEASGQDVEGIMGDWVKQPGHPTIDCAWDGRLQLRQYRTTSSPMAGDQPGLWRVPMVIRYADAAGVHEHRILFDREEATVDLNINGELEWLWPNAHDGGFYRSRLDARLLSAALDNAAALEPAEQVALLRDLWMQVRAGRTAPQDFLHAFEVLLGGDDYEVTEFQAGVVRMLDGLLHGKEGQKELRQRIAATLHDAWVDAPADSPPQRQRRAALLRVLGVCQDPDAVAEARRLAAAERAGAADDAQLATVAVAVEALNGDTSTLDIHLATYDARRNADASPQDVERYLYALPSFRDEDALVRILDMLKDATVAAQAEGPILRAMLTSPDAQALAWQHLQTHWDATIERLGEAWLAIIVEACGELPTGEKDAITAFLDARLDGRAAQAYGRAKERLDERAELEARVVPALQEWVS